MTLSDRVVSADVLDNHYIVVTADLKIHIFDLVNPSAPVRTIPTSPLITTPRAVKIFHDKKFFAVSSLEGRCCVKTIDAALDNQVDPLQPTRPLTFTFRCHRSENLRMIYPVNFIDTHPAAAYNSVFLTGGSEGTVVLWQRAERHRLTFSFTRPLPVVDGHWNATGDLIVVGSSYDWSKGQEYYNKDAQNTITVRHTPEQDLLTPNSLKKK